MSDREPVLSRLHRCTPEGRVDRYSRDRFALFLIGWLGGPQDYIAQHGHPRLRMRHARFAIGAAEAEAWLGHMTDAVKATGMDPDDEQELLDYLTMAARSLVNTPG